MIIEVTVENLKKHRKNPIRAWVGNAVFSLSITEAVSLADKLDKAINESQTQEIKWCVEAIERKTK